jgi:hypothetical protein
MRKLPQSDGGHIHDYIAELAEVVTGVRQSNMAGFGRTATELENALEALSDATRHLQRLVSGGQTEKALAGATPYLRLFALAAGGAYLARGALADGGEQRIGLCRFFAENLVGETGALRDRIIEGADGLLAAGKGLISA